MRTPIIAMALMLTAGVANAAPIYLSCSGDWWLGDLDDVSLGRDTFSLVVDIDKGTVTHKGWILNIDGSFGNQIVASIGEKRDWRHLRLDRVTGEIHVVVPVREHPGIFGGTCKPVQKLF